MHQVHGVRLVIDVQQHGLSSCYSVLAHFVALHDPQQTSKLLYLLPELLLLLLCSMPPPAAGANLQHRVRISVQRLGNVAVSPSITSIARPEQGARLQQLLCPVLADRDQCAHHQLVSQYTDLTINQS